MKLFVCLFFLSTAASAACEKKDHLKAAADFVKKELPEGTQIGINHVADSEYSYVAQDEDAHATYRENGSLRISEVDGKCRVERFQQQKSTEPKKH